MNQLTYHPTIPLYKEKYGTNVFVLSNGCECGGRNFREAKAHAERVIRGEVVFVSGEHVSEYRTIERNR
jgi:hypothetical protein